MSNLENTLTNNYVEPSPIGNKHRSNKSYGMCALRQSQKRSEKLTKQIDALPKKMREKLRQEPPSAGHGKRIGKKHAPPRFKDEPDEHSSVYMANQYCETVQGDDDAYVEIEKDQIDDFFEEHFRLLKELGEDGYQEYLDAVFTTRDPKWTAVREKMKKREDACAILQRYYDETDAHLNPEFVRSLKADMICDEEWTEMVDEVNREQGYY